MSVFLSSTELTLLTRVAPSYPMLRRLPPPGPLPALPGRVGPALQPPLGPFGAPAQVRGVWQCAAGAILID